jgi:hypothetical protein
MNERLRQFERMSHIDVYALGKERERWEVVLEQFAQLIVEECAMSVDNNGRFLTYQEMANKIRKELK